MSPVREALDRFLKAHEPYPALVVDGRWNLVAANDAIGPLVAGCAPDLLTAPANVLRLSLHPDGMAPRIGNLAEWSSHLLHRLRRTAALTAAVELEALYNELRSYPGDQSDVSHDGVSADIVLPLRMTHNGDELAFLSTISTFGTATDVTLAELSVEAFYPADAATAAVLLAAGEPR